MAQYIKTKPLKGIKQEFNNETPEIFISPLEAYGLYYLLLFTIAIPLAFFLRDKGFNLINKWSFLVYFIVILLHLIWFRFANCSFYVYKQNKILRVINPYYPFKKDISIRFDKIEEILFFRYLNRIKVIEKNGYSKVHFCNCLQSDAYDEHYVDKTFDDFFYFLERCSLNVKMLHD